LWEEVYRINANTIDLEIYENMVGISYSHKIKISKMWSFLQLGWLVKPWLAVAKKKNITEYY